DIACGAGQRRVTPMTVPNLEWQDRPELREPVLVCAFHGWNDAGEAASAAVKFLVDATGAQQVARIDPEEFYDFTAVRPTVRLGFERTSYEGPTGIVGVLHASCAAAGIDSASLWAPVPHYVAATPNPKAALALVRGFEGVAGIAIDAGDLETASDDYDRQVS